MTFIAETNVNNTGDGRAISIAMFEHQNRRIVDKAPGSFTHHADNTDLSADDVKSVLGMFGRIGFGSLVLDECKRVIKWNDAARVALDLAANQNDEAKAVSTAFKQLISPVSCNFTPGSVSWVAIPYKGARPVVIRDETEIDSDRLCIVLLLSRETCPHPNPERLQQMFGLTCAEVQLATRLVSGQSPLEIAEQYNVSRTTIRSHLAALFSKTDTNRQAELVSLLRQVSVLP